MFSLRAPLLSMVALALATLTGCAAEPATPDASFNLYASGSGPPRAAGAKAPLGTPTGPSGDPGSLQLDVQALYLGAAADCSDVALVETYGAGGSVADLMANPLLFSASPPDGAYACMALQMSDVIHATPATSFGACVAGQDYPSDIYHGGERDWEDPAGDTIIGHGDEVTPVEDDVTIFISTDPSAAIARGLSLHQVISLGAPLVVPGQMTFYWDATGSVVSSGGECWIQPGHPTFE